MRRPQSALGAAIVALGLSAPVASAQQLFNTSASPSTSNKDSSSPLDPMAASRGARYLLRNGADYIEYKEYGRALRFLREAEARQAELSDTERKSLRAALDRAQKGLREVGDAGSRSRSRRPGAMATATPAPAPARGDEGARLAASAPTPSSSPSRPGPSPGPIAAREAPQSPAPAASREPAVRRASTSDPVTPVELPAPPASLPEPAAPPALVDLPTPGPTPAPLPAGPSQRSVELPPPSQAAPAPEPLPVASPAVLTLEPLPEPSASAVQLPPPAAPDPLPMPAPIPALASGSVPDATPASLPASEPAAPGPLPVPAPAPAPLPVRDDGPLSPAANSALTRLRQGRPAPPAEAPVMAPAPAPISEAVPVIDDRPPTSMPALAPEPAPAPPAEELPVFPGGTRGASPMPAPAMSPAASADEPTPSATRRPFGPELEAEIARIAQLQSDEARARVAQAPGGTPGLPPLPGQPGSGTVPIDESSALGGSSSTRFELTRAPSPTEAFPLRRIPVPEEFVPAVPRDWSPNRKYWQSHALCHTPLYFQDAALERYGHAVEHFAGPHGRFLSYPVDSPRQSKQRNYILQPIFSAGLFAAQIITLPYNLLVDPPWEAEYDLGYYRPGDKIPTDTYYLPLTGVGPPLRGKDY